MMTPVMRFRLLAVVLLAAAAVLPAAAGSASAAKPTVSFTLYKVPLPAVDELDPGPDHNLWFDRNMGGNYTSEIGKITPAGKAAVYKPKFSIAGSYPGRIAAGPDGKIWFPLKGEGKHAGLGTMATDGGGATAFAVPDVCVYCSVESVVTAPDKHLWVGQMFQVVREYNPAGQLQRTVDLTPLKLPPANVNAMAVGHDGRIWFSAGTWIGAIDATSGTPSGYLTPSKNPNITDLIAGPDGNLWFTEYDPTVTKIGRITTSGHVTEFSAGLSPKAGPLRLAVGPDHAIWFTEANVHQIGRITTTGHITEYAIPASINMSAAGIALGADHRLWVTFPGLSAIGRLIVGPACVVPNLVGQTLKAATSALKHARCRLGAVHRTGRSTKPVVASQSQPPGTTLDRGSRVDVAVH